MRHFLNLNIYTKVKKALLLSSLYEACTFSEKRERSNQRRTTQIQKLYSFFLHYSLTLGSLAPLCKLQFYQTTPSDVVRVPLQFTKQIIVIAQGME